jgi:hypothetical protein
MVLTTFECKNCAYFPVFLNVQKIKVGYRNSFHGPVRIAQKFIIQIHNIVKIFLLWSEKWKNNVVIRVSVNVSCRGSTTGDSKIWGLTGDAGNLSKCL